ncbi:MAG: adenine phosphoribosyltransferase [Lachnospiraceae bacterium]|nr:adenine phosphoribosyltransferase [Lachnospiraceae bacterium]
MKDIKDYIRTIPDFPQKGIMFRDITTLIQNADGLKLAVDSMCDAVSDLDYDVIAGAESRGFVFGAPMAYREHKPFVLIRKKGKLPGQTVSQSYDLEYGSTEIEMHTDSFEKGAKVLIVDDLIATGGTTDAMIKLVEKLGGEVVGVCVLIELPDLKGREKIAGYRLDSIVSYEGE